MLSQFGNRVLAVMNIFTSTFEIMFHCYVPMCKSPSLSGEFHSAGRVGQVQARRQRGSKSAVWPSDLCSGLLQKVPGAINPLYLFHLFGMILSKLSFSWKDNFIIALLHIYSYWRPNPLRWKSSCGRSPLSYATWISERCDITALWQPGCK